MTIHHESKFQNRSLSQEFKLYW